MQNYQYDFSIIIVNWNTRELVLQCVQSFYTCSQPLSFEIIVVDNASSDDSVSALRTHFPDVKVIVNSENLGFARANNIGIRASSGRFVCLVNSDILIFNNVLQQMAEHLTSAPDIGILSPQLLDLQRKPQISCRRFPSLWQLFCTAVGLDKLAPGSRFFGGDTLKIPSQTQPVDVVSGAFWMVRPEAIAQVGLLDESFFFYSEDVDWCKRFWQKGWQVVYYPAAQAIHHEARSSSIAPLRYYIEFRRSRWVYWKKHHSRISQHLFWFIAFTNQVIRILGQSTMLIFKPTERKVTQAKIKRNFKCAQWLLSMTENS